MEQKVKTRKLGEAQCVHSDTHEPTYREVQYEGESESDSEEELVADDKHYQHMYKLARQQYLEELKLDPTNKKIAERLLLLEEEWKTKYANKV